MRLLWQELLKGVDIVFHVAAMAGIWGSWNAYYAANVVGTEVVVESCRKNKVPHAGVHLNPLCGL